MIRDTVKTIAKKLEHFTQYDIPVSRCLDLLESQARTIEEMVVIEVMRESIYEVRGELPAALQADATSRTARMPSMAFKR